MRVSLSGQTTTDFVVVIAFMIIFIVILFGIPFLN